MTAKVGELASGESASPAISARVAPIWLALALLAGLFSLLHDGLVSYENVLGYPGWGSIGADIGDVSCQADGFCSVTKLVPGAPLAVLGVRDGDGVRFDHSYDFNRVLRVGEAVGFSLSRDGLLSHHVVTAKAQPAPPQSQRIGDDLQGAMCILMSLVGLLVVFRGGRRAPAFLLGAGLACLGLFAINPTLLESDPRIFPAYLFLAKLVWSAPPILLLAFALAARQQSGQKVGRLWTAVLIAYGVAQITCSIYRAWRFLSGTPIEMAGATRDIMAALQVLGFVLCFLVLAVGWRQSRGDERTRYGFMLVATVLLTTCSQILRLVINLTDQDWTLGNPLVVVDLVGCVAGTLVFAYAVLRHRIVDLGFAVNRTLVYAVVSAVLLVAFGLIEWAVDHFVPIQGREENVLVDAAIAVGVFLTFHRVRAVVEHGIEGVFFRRWQQAEAALRRFVREAAFVKSAEALDRAFAAAMTRFADEAEAALYLLDDDGYRRASGRVTGVGEFIEVDDPVLVALRAEPKPLEPGDTRSSLAATLAAPMLHRNDVIGVVLLGRKPSGLSYRPDEIELIGWATQQVGLDLHALKVERLEIERADLATTIAVLEHALSLKSAAA